MLQSRHPVKPLFTPGEAITCHTPSAVRGGRVVQITAGRQGSDADGGPQITVGYGPAGSGLAFGVTSFDTDPETSSTTVQRLRTIVMPVDVGTTAVVGGQPVAVDAEGRVVPVSAAGAGAVAIGVALDSAAPGARVYVDRNVRA